MAKKPSEWSDNDLQLFEKIVFFRCRKRNSPQLLVIALLNGIHNSCTPLLVATWECAERISVHSPCTDQKRGTTITCTCKVKRNGLVKSTAVKRPDCIIVRIIPPTVMYSASCNSVCEYIYVYHSYYLLKCSPFL